MESGGLLATVGSIVSPQSLQAEAGNIRVRQVLSFSVLPVRAHPKLILELPGVSHVGKDEPSVGFLQKLTL